MIHIRNKSEIAQLREAGRMTAQCMQHLAALIEAGITTGELDRQAEQFIRKHGGIPTFKGYSGYPGSICASINEEVVHGIPGSRKLMNGDLVSIDLGVTYNGWVGDMARTFAVGEVEPNKLKLMEVTQACFEAGMNMMRPGNRLGDVSNAVQTLAESHGYGVVRDLCGHGVGRDMHEDPELPNFGRAGRGVRLQAGMILALEPMINEGTWKVRFLDDGWTVISADHSPSAHYENTIAITEDGPMILTAL